MIPTTGCTRCKLSEGRKRIVSSFGPLPADVLVISDSINGPDEIIGRPQSGPDGRLLDELFVEASERLGVKLSIHVVPLTLCRAHTESVDRQPSPVEVLKCTPNVIKIADECRPKVVVLLGEVAKNYYAKEFQDAINLLPCWFIRKHPSFWNTAVSQLTEGLRRCL